MAPRNCTGCGTKQLRMLWHHATAQVVAASQKSAAQLELQAHRLLMASWLADDGKQAGRRRRAGRQAGKQLQAGEKAGNCRQASRQAIAGWHVAGNAGNCGAG